MKTRAKIETYMYIAHIRSMQVFPILLKLFSQFVIIQAKRKEVGWLNECSYQI